MALRSESSLRVVSQDNPRHARECLLRKIRSDDGLPSLGSSVCRVVQLASSDKEAVRDLAHFILSDVGLTQKILRIANTVRYRGASSAPITTIFKAIFLLGFDTVKTSALTMLLVEGMSGKHARNVRTELTRAIAASIIGRELASHHQVREVEEVAIAALFKNIARLIIASHDHDLYERMTKLVDDGRHTLAQAALEVLGCSLDAIGEAILQEWNIPDVIMKTLASPPAGTLKPAKTSQEWVQQAACFSAAAASLIPGRNRQIDPAASKALLDRFSLALNIDAHKLEELLTAAAAETRILVAHADIGSDIEAIDADEEEKGGSGLPEELVLHTLDHPNLNAQPRLASGKPVNARDLLLTGVQDVTQMMSSGRCNVNDLLLLVLEILYGSMGFRLAAVCLKDISTLQYRVRIAMGEKNKAFQRGYSFSCAPPQDIFHLALENDADLMIADTAVPKIRNLLPAWHRELLPDARSFIVLPLVLHKKPIGMFYADRIYPAPEGVPPDETALMKTLKGQVLMALQAR